MALKGRNLLSSLFASSRSSLTCTYKCGNAGTRGGKETREKVAAFKRHYYCSKRVENIVNTRGQPYI